MLHCNWIWLRIHKVRLPEVRTKMVWHCGGDAHHCFLLLNPGDILFGFWAPFGAMSSSVILPVEVRISWIVVREFWGSSSSSPSPRSKSSSCSWSIVLVGLRIFYVVDVSRILRLRSPSHFSIALSRFILLSHSSAMIIIRQDVLFKFIKKFINCLWLFSCQVRSGWS
jgi:hypothetical protein